MMSGQCSSPTRRFVAGRVVPVVPEANHRPEVIREQRAVEVARVSVRAEAEWRLNHPEVIRSAGVMTAMPNAKSLVRR